MGLGWMRFIRGEKEGKMRGCYTLAYLFLNL